MSRLAVLAPLLLLSGIAVAQISAPDCSLTWKWTFNSLGQNACTVAAYLMSTCYGGAFSIPPLGSGEPYTGPSGVDDGDLCQCNTVTYSLISACDACQQKTWITWYNFSYNCTRTMPVSSFPNPVPSGTRVPQWALLDVTLEDTWNSSNSLLVGDSPEVLPGTGIPPSDASSTSSTPSSTPTPPSPTPTHTSSNAGAIAGGVVGGVAAIAAAGLAIFFWVRRKARPQDPSVAFVVDGAPQPLMGELRPLASDDGTYMAPPMPGTPGTPGTPMRLYDPRDPNTFPGFQGAGQIHTEVPVAHSGNTLANIQTSPPPGYHGLSTV